MCTPLGISNEKKKKKKTLEPAGVVAALSEALPSVCLSVPPAGVVSALVVALPCVLSCVTFPDAVG